MNSAYIEKRYPENIRPEVFRALMQHPIGGVPRILSLRLDGDEWVLTKEYIQGETLAARIIRQLPAKKEALSICRRLCDILEQVHSLGIIHGDIKPENIIIGDDGGVYLIDFDAARFVKRDAGRDTVIMGTPGYAPPEQTGYGRSDVRSDIYAMGVLLNVMITGKHPQYEKARGSIGYIVEKCTRLEPEKRYQNVKELKRGLGRPARGCDFLPPGFRTMRPWHMILACAGYSFLIWGCFFSEALRKQTVGNKILGFLQPLGIIFICCDYLGVNSLFMKKKSLPRAVVVVLEILIYSAVLMLLYGVVLRIIN